MVSFELEFEFELVPRERDILVLALLLPLLPVLGLIVALFAPELERELAGLLLGEGGTGGVAPIFITASDPELELDENTSLTF